MPHLPRSSSLALLLLIGCATSPTAPPAGDLGLPELEARSQRHWQQQRRPEVLTLFEEHVYGRAPDLGRTQVAVTSTKPDALGGLATRLHLQVSLARFPAWKGIDVMLYVPNDTPGPVPCFVGLSFRGNHAVSTEPDVAVANDNERGSEASRWPLEMILRHGVAGATAWYGDIEPDHDEGWREGLRGIAAPDGAAHVWLAGEWGAIGAWAFGLGCIADALAGVAAVDSDRLAVIGHSRLGKTALWAGAQDRRFSVVVSNNSGEGGAALMRRPVGESTANITSAFPHWFTKTYSGYAEEPARCPVDQHMLIALMAPRAVYIGSAVEDLWADPEGEYLAGLYASPVWRLFGSEGITVGSWPAPDTPVGQRVGYHVRSGGHDVTDYDWRQYLAFARRYWDSRDDS